MILVLGATGTTGGEVARQLIASGERPRLLVRTPEKAKQFKGSAEIIQGAVDDDGSLSAAMQGVDRMYLVSSGLEGPALEARAIDAAKREGVKHVVKLSVVGADRPEFSFAKLHSRSEKHLKDSGLAWTMLRPTNFMTNALGWASTIKSAGAFYMPIGKGRFSSIDPADVGAVAVRVLTSPGHEGKAYSLTGPEALDGPGHAAVLASVLGKPVTFVDVPPEAARGSMLESGMPAAYVEAIIDLLAFIKAGKSEDVTDSVREVTGRQPSTFESWVRRNIAAFT